MKRFLLPSNPTRYVMILLTSALKHHRAFSNLRSKPAFTIDAIPLCNIVIVSGNSMVLSVVTASCPELIIIRPLPLHRQCCRMDFSRRFSGPHCRFHALSPFSSHLHHVHHHCRVSYVFCFIPSSVIVFSSTSMLCNKRRTPGQSTCMRPTGTSWPQTAPLRSSEFLMSEGERRV